MTSRWPRPVRYLREVVGDFVALIAFVAGDRGAPPADRAL
jgi:hypothetical protein